MSSAGDIAFIFEADTSVLRVETGLRHLFHLTPAAFPPNE
jgi:hypothetical protein